MSQYLKKKPDVPLMPSILNKDLGKTNSFNRMLLHRDIDFIRHGVFPVTDTDFEDWFFVRYQKHWIMTYTINTHEASGISDIRIKHGLILQGKVPFQSTRIRYLPENHVKLYIGAPGTSDATAWVGSHNYHQTTQLDLMLRADLGQTKQLQAFFKAAWLSTFPAFSREEGVALLKST